MGMQQMLLGTGGRYKVTLTISASVNNYTLNTASVSNYQAGNTDVTVNIGAGVVIGSTTTGAAFTVDTSWNAHDNITIVNTGSILGSGGNGGDGGVYYNAPGSNGYQGGLALYVQSAVSFTNTSGIVGGGGGGGGGGHGAGISTTWYSNGGGGGAGYVNSVGGIGFGTPTSGASGTPGTSSAGGAGGTSLAGNGGNLGAAGGVGTNSGSGGAAGAATSGKTFINGGAGITTGTVYGVQG